MAEITYRPARLEEAADILTVLIELAAEIPVQVEPLEREEALYALIRHCARSGESWVAVDGSRMIGFVLAELDQARRHYAEHEVLELRYGGVLKMHRHRGIFTLLVKQTLARMLPVMATVSPANRSGAARLLENLGFTATGLKGGEQRFRWDPGAIVKRVE